MATWSTIRSQLNEAKNHPAADELNSYAKKSGGIDKKDFQVAAGKLNNYKATGNPGAIADLVKMLNGLDTEPMEKILVTIKKHDKAMAKTIEKKMGISIKEGLEVKIGGGKVPVGQHKLKYSVDKPDKYIENSIKERDPKAKFERKGKDLYVTASAQAHSSLIASLRKFRVDGTISESFDLAEAPEDNEPASPDEKGMAIDQAKFIKYVGDEIIEYLNKNNEFPEWMQNKLSSLHENAKGLHATMAGKYNESVEIDEAVKYTDKQIKMAYGIINDPRYKSGNMTAIVKKIEQIAKGLSKHPGVVKAIQVTNESVDLEEKLKVGMGIEAWIRDFVKSDAPQFAGKTKEEKIKMAIAAYQAAEKEEKSGSKKEESKDLGEAAPKISMGKAKGSIKASGLRGKDMKQYDVDVSVVNGKFEFKVKDQSGAFKTMSLGQVARIFK